MPEPSSVAGGARGSGNRFRGGERDGGNQSLVARAATDASDRFVMRGVMKIRSSVFLRLIVLFLNSQPRPGIFDRPGTPIWFTELFSLKMPPMTAVPPSATRIWVAARSVMIGGTS